MILIVFAQFFCLTHIILLRFIKTELQKAGDRFLLRAWLLHEWHADICCFHCSLYFCWLLNSSPPLPLSQWFFLPSVGSLVLITLSQMLCFSPPPAHPTPLWNLSFLLPVLFFSLILSFCDTISLFISLFPDTHSFHSTGSLLASSNL